jgi:LytS/YehU family sensor histidine kinase
VILAGRPIASSVRKAAVVAALVVLAYASLDVFFIAAGSVVLNDPIHAASGPGVALLDEGAKLVLLAVAGGITIYATWWHESMARQYAHDAHEREQLRVRLAASRLDSLKQQLQPHFLFNALNAISALVDSDPRGAQRMISGLGELIRVSLDGGGEQEVPLARELAVLDHYVSIQRIRFEDRLQVVTEADETLCDALVPALILQPLVENAIKHGLAQRAEPTRIDVRATREGDAVILSVADDGPGLEGRPVSSIVERVGVGNARARLAYLYGRRHGFTIDSPVEGGFTVRIRIPYRTSRELDGAAERAS